MKSVPLSAFNLIPGAVFTLGITDEPDENRPKYCVTQVLYRHAGTERVGVLCRVLGEFIPGEFSPKTPDEVGFYGVGKYDTFSFDFNDTVYLIGLVVNPDTWDDTDFGQDKTA